MVESRHATRHNPKTPHRVDPLTAVRKYKVGDRVLVKLSGGVRLQVSFGDETALIYEWQIVEEGR